MGMPSSKLRSGKEPEYQGYNNPSFDLLWHPSDDAQPREQHSLRPETRAGEPSNLGPGRGSGPPRVTTKAVATRFCQPLWKCHDGDSPEGLGSYM